jgi:hypothetical protein
VALAPGARVAIINVCAFHHEVYPAFHFAFQRAGYTTTTYATGWEKRDLLPGLRDWNFKVIDIAALKAVDFCGNDLAVFTSIGYSPDYLFAAELVKIGCVMNFIFVIHNVNNIVANSLRMLVETAPNIEIYTLAPHTAARVQSMMVSRDYFPALKVSYLIPVFPFRCFGSNGGDSDDMSTGFLTRHGGNFVVQGSIDPIRRNYNELIADLTKHQARLPPQLRLIILGARSNLTSAGWLNQQTIDFSVPEAMRHRINRIENAPYCEYFGQMRRSVALLTAFASNAYFKNKASSTVAASLITNAPLLTTPKTPSVYDYLSADSIWSKRIRQTDVEAMMEILSMPDVERVLLEKKRSLAEDAARAYERNTRTVAASMAAFGKTSTKLDLAASL